jgi:hypothetical protein
MIVKNSNNQSYISKAQGGFDELTNWYGGAGLDTIKDQ